MASPGMVQMAETGVIDMLADEIRGQIGQGKAYGTLTWRWWVCAEGIVNNSCGTSIFEFEVDSEFPLVTLTTMAGQQVARLLRGQRPAGRYTLTWDGLNDAGETLATGVYIYRLRAGNLVQSRKLLR